MSKVRENPPYPKRPLTGYFRFQAELREKEKVGAKEVKSKWDSLEERKREAYNKVYDDEMAQFRKDKEVWEKKYGKPETKRDKKEVKDISKAEKEKGSIDRKAKSKKEEEKKGVASKSNEKREKSKGRPEKSKK